MVARQVLKQVEMLFLFLNAHTQGKVNTSSYFDVSKKKKIIHCNDGYHFSNFDIIV